VGDSKNQYIFLAPRDKLEVGQESRGYGISNSVCNAFFVLQDILNSNDVLGLILNPNNECATSSIYDIDEKILFEVKQGQ
jgi:hypothetical protein